MIVKCCCLGPWALKNIDYMWIHPTWICRRKRNKRQGDSSSICGSTTFFSYDFIQNIFKIGVAIVEITKIVQNAGPISAMAQYNPGKKHLWRKGVRRALYPNFQAFFVCLFCVFYNITGFLKTVLVKKINSFYYLAINLKQKIIQRPIKSLSLTPGSKLEVPRSISTSANLKWRTF